MRHQGQAHHTLSDNGPGKHLVEALRRTNACRLNLRSIRGRLHEVGTPPPHRYDVGDELVAPERNVERGAILKSTRSE